MKKTELYTLLANTVLWNNRLPFISKPLLLLIAANSISPYANNTTIKQAQQPTNSEFILMRELNSLHINHYR